MVRVLFLGNLANVSYLLAHGLSRFHGVDALLLQKLCDANAMERDVLYGFRSGNPYQVNLKAWYSGSGARAIAGVSKWFLAESRQLQADIVHLTGLGSLEMSLFCRLKRAKLVRHFHGGDLREAGPARLAVQALARESAALVSTPDLLGLWPRRSIWLPNPVDPLFFSLKESEDHSIFVHAPLEPIKRPEVIFAAWARLRQLDKEVCLRVSERGRLAKLYHEKFRTDTRVEWVKLLSRQDTVQVLNKSKVIWGQHPWAGTFGLSELEGLACGKPVFAAFDSARYPSNYCPPVFSSNDPAEIARSTDVLLKDSLMRKRIGEKATKWVTKFHGLENVSLMLRDIYRSVL